MEFFGVYPGRRLVVSFLAAIVVGTILLFLPISAAETPISFIDALFTATSAVCVTGLVVVDTGTTYSIFGQLVILGLIQLGGLGIMTFATSLLMISGARVPFLDRLGISQVFGAPSILKNVLWAVLMTTVVVEGIGALFLFPVFLSDYPAGQAAYYAIFHSVSAFCNAGFSIFSDSLERYAGNVYVLTVFAGLIICGGLGFIVIRELIDRARNRRAKLSLHTKLCLSMSIILIAVGAVAFLVAEYNNTLADMNAPQRAANALFQSVSCRTAGFNTLPQHSLTEVSLLLSLLLMFVGACPGSTGGGIKTTTAAVILLLVYHRFRGRQSVSAFRRSIDTDSISRSLTVVLLASLVIVVILGLLMFAEQRPQSHMLSQGWFVDNMFEVVSAFGTVGLSLGMTGHVNVPGKILLMVLMFVGRVGLLTLAFTLARPVRKGEIIYTDESVMIG